ncbi:MAG: transcription factor S [archaeon]
MQFCPKCGAILIQKTKRFACPKCSYASNDKVKLFSCEKMEEKQKIGVLKEKDTNVWPVVTETCPTCGNNKAYYHSVQMRSGDEGETRFYRCAKCKHNWQARN